MVFVFPIGRIPRLASVIWEKKNLVRNLSIPFYLGIPTLMGVGGHLSGFRGIGRPGNRLQPSVVEGPGGPGWTFTQGPLSRWSLFRKFGGSLAVVGSSLGKCGLIPRVRATELSWAG